MSDDSMQNNEYYDTDSEVSGSMLLDIAIAVKILTTVTQMNH